MRAASSPPRRTWPASYAAISTPIPKTPSPSAGNTPTPHAASTMVYLSLGQSTSSKGDAMLDRIFGQTHTPIPDQHRRAPSVIRSPGPRAAQVAIASPPSGHPAPRPLETALPRTRLDSMARPCRRQERLAAKTADSNDRESSRYGVCGRSLFPFSRAASSTRESASRMVDWCQGHNCPVRSRIESTG